MVKVLLSVDAALLRRLDEEAAARGVSRSALLTEFAARGLGELTGPGAQLSVREALRRARQLFAQVHDSVDSTQAVRAMRDAR